MSCVLPLVALAAPLGPTGKAFAAEPDKQFFRTVEGKWVGPGEIIAGKYKGTKFTCSFDGSTPDNKTGMTLDGDCRVGVFTQKMSATVERKGRDYKGNFMGGAAGSGLDIIGGNVVDARKVVFTINRNQLRGVMQARIPDDNSMTVTIAVRVDQQLVPVIGMSLKRVDAVEVGSIAKN
ncbi:signal peptide protein [Mesorhizobium sp. LSHC412B00]|nr:signal peptide protein [Mesorhizobium sp. LSHC412B00]